jgi:hypothetical protein
VQAVPICQAPDTDAGAGRRDFLIRRDGGLHEVLRPHVDAMSGGIAGQ